MKIEQGYPPNIEAIKKAFPSVAVSKVVFTYGDTIFAPHGTDLAHHLVAHEEVHIQQQKEFPGGPEAWWELYLASPNFRLAEELKAYRNQYHKYCQLASDRNAQSKFLFRIATDLASPIYECDITVSQARVLIKNHI